MNDKNIEKLIEEKVIEIVDCRLELLEKEVVRLRGKLRSLRDQRLLAGEKEDDLKKEVQ